MIMFVGHISNLWQPEYFVEVDLCHEIWSNALSHKFLDSDGTVQFELPSGVLCSCWVGVEWRQVSKNNHALTCWGKKLLPSFLQ